MDDEVVLCVLLGVCGGEMFVVMVIVFEDVVVVSFDVMVVVLMMYASMVNMDEDEAFARALVMSMNEGVDGILMFMSDFI